jgi:16S rRNA (cytosine967-C5)-methyltransferase
VRNILRLGLFQLQFMDRIPASAAVNTAVNLARSHRSASAAGFINALLRNVLRDPGRYRPPRAHDDPVEYIAVTHSLPRWLAARWLDRLGMEETQQLCAAVNSVPPISLRCNSLATTVPGLIAALGDQARAVDPMPGITGGLNLVGPRRPIQQMPAFRKGHFTVQDGAAQLVSLMVAPRPGETVLDACAGLGGKTTHLAQLMKNQGHVIALDRLAPKLTRLDQEARRLGLTIIDTRCMDLDRPPDPTSLPRFDRILVDAPCSGLGVLRRNPDARWSARKLDVARFADRQVRFLDHLAPLLKSGGTLVFAVCSMEPEENRQVVERFLIKRPNFAITGRQSMDATAVAPFLDAHGCLHTAPHVHHLDGFFAARLVRVH